MTKRNIMLTIEYEIIEKAKKQGLNISQAAQQGILKELKEDFNPEQVQAKVVEEKKEKQIKESILTKHINTKKRAEMYQLENRELWNETYIKLKEANKLPFDHFKRDCARIKLFEKWKKERGVWIKEVNTISAQELMNMKFPCRYCNRPFKYYVQDLKERGMIRKVCGIHIKQFRKSQDDKILWGV